MEKISQSDPKDVEYYAAQANAWFSTSLEHDKSILSLSSGAIGLLVTLLTTVGTESTLDKWLYVLSMLSYVISVATILVIFQKNKSYLEALVKNKEHKLEIELKRYDLIAILAFCVGIIFTVLIGISAVFASNTRKNEMPDKMIIDEALRIVHEERLFESYTGAKNMSPKPNFESYAGANKMSPDPIAVEKPAGDTQVTKNTEATTASQPATPDSE